MKHLPDRLASERQISRRNFVFSGAALAAAAALPLRSPASATPAPLAFDIIRGGDVVGRHALNFRREKGDLHVDIAIDIEIKFTFITLFRYWHRNHEVWRDGRLVSLETKTDDDGDEYEIRARANGDELWVNGSGGEYIAPGTTLPTSYWDSRTPLQNTLLDTQRGGLLEVQVEDAGADVLALRDMEVAARKYVMSGDLTLDLWYTTAGEWVKIAFEARGETVEYAPVTSIDGDRPDA